MVRVPGRHGAVRLPERGRRRLLGRGRRFGGGRRAAAAGPRRAGRPRRSCPLRARLLGRRADPVAGVDPGGRPRRRLHRLDRRPAAPVRVLVGAGGDGSDLGVRQEWLPLFDTYEVDLVLSGHDHGYERSFPVRGADAAAGTDIATGAAADTRRPRPVTMVDSGVFDTSQGTVHLVLGGGSARTRAGPTAPGASPRVARVITRPRVRGGRARPRTSGRQAARPARPRRRGGGDLVGAARRRRPGTASRCSTSARAARRAARRPSPCGTTMPSVRSWPTPTSCGPAAGGPGSTAGDYIHFETFTLVRPRSDGRRWHPKG